MMGKKGRPTVNSTKYVKKRSQRNRGILRWLLDGRRIPVALYNLLRRCMIGGGA